MSKTVDDLKSALLQCDRPTQKFIQPLLGVKAVQHMLMVFLEDDRKTIQEWIWDPKAHSRLEKLRDMVTANPSGDSTDLSLKFRDVLGMSMTAKALAAPRENEVAIDENVLGKNSDTDVLLCKSKVNDEDLEVKILSIAAQGMREKAKKLFLEKNYRGSFEGFMAAAISLEKVEGISDARMKAKEICSTCFCNAAVSAAKAGLTSDTVDAATRALNFHGNHRMKAFYWRARARQAQDMDELALKDMENLLDLDPHLPEALALRDMLRMRIENKRVARDADALWEMKRAELELEEKKRLEENERKRLAEWEPRKPPTLIDPTLKTPKFPAQLVAEYASKNHFSIAESIDYTEEGYVCKMKLPGDCNVSSCVRRSTIKAARQASAAELLIAAAKRWNLKNPGDMVDMELMKIPEDSALKKVVKSAEEPVPSTNEFKNWAQIWLNILSDYSEEGKLLRNMPRGRLRQLLFPASLSAQDRSFVRVTGGSLETSPEILGLRAKSSGGKQNRRILITRDDETDDVGYNPLVLEVPEPFILPHEVDLVKLTQVEKTLG